MALFKKKPSGPGAQDVPPGIEQMQQGSPTQVGKMPFAASPPSGPLTQKAGIEEHPFPPQFPPSEQESIKQQVGYPDDTPQTSEFKPPKYMEPAKGEKLKDTFEDEYGDEMQPPEEPTPQFLPPESEKFAESGSYPVPPPPVGETPQPYKGEDEPERGTPEFGESGTELSSEDQSPEVSQTAPLIPPPPPAAAAQGLAQSAAEGVKQELETELKSLKQEVDDLKEIDDQMQEMVDVLKNIEAKYESMEKKVGQFPPEKERELTEIKDTVDNLNALVSKALPALIVKVKEIADAVKLKEESS